MQDVRRAVILGVSLMSSPGLAQAAGDAAGKALLERNCGRCHALVPGFQSPLDKAPNLWVVLRSYTSERLEFELAEGIGSRHRDMPQIQFTSEEIAAIQNYLSDE